MRSPDETVALNAVNALAFLRDPRTPPEALAALIEDPERSLDTRRTARGRCRRSSRSSTSRIFLRWLDTGLTRLPARIDIGALGTRTVRFIASDLVLDDSVFEDPQQVVAQAVRPRQGAITRALRSPGDLPAEPEVQVVRAQMLLVVGDPGGWDFGDWAGRARALAAAAARLAEQGQTGDGLPVYQRVAEGYRILLPFRPDPWTRMGSRPPRR